MNEQQIIKQFSEQVKMQFDIESLTVYKNSEKMCGEQINPVEMERYLALPCTAIFKEMETSRMVTHINVGTYLYLIILNSRSSSAFDGLEQVYIIEEFKKLKRKLGDMT